MPTPLVDALRRHAALDPAPFHMPGHKGRLTQDWSAWDVTELSDTGDLYVGGDAIAQAEALWAAVWGVPCCQFLTGGSTQGLHAALLLCARENGPGILVDRACHRSVYNGLALFRMTPAYLPRTQTEPVDPAALERALDAHPEAKTVCITSPTYYGVLSDIPALSEICRRRHTTLLVDAAHGAHLPFLGTLPARGADLAVTSAHKTLPALGQAALLFSAGRFSDADLRWAASVCGTSSPSYPVMASMDAARDYLEGEPGREALRRAASAAAGVKSRRSTLPACADPLRLTLTVNAAAAPGHALQALLESRGVFPEMSDRDHVVLLFGAHTTPSDVTRLEAALEEAAAQWPRLWDAPLPTPRPPVPEVVLSPAAALLLPGESIPLDRAGGRVSLRTIAPYPPGVPVVAPGERLTKKCLAYLREVGYNVSQRGDFAPLQEG